MKKRKTYNVKNITLNDDKKLEDIIVSPLYKKVINFLNNTPDNKVYTLSVLAKKINVAETYLKNVSKEAFDDYRILIKRCYCYGNPRTIKKLRDYYGNDREASV